MSARSALTLLVVSLGGALVLTGCGRSLFSQLGPSDDFDGATSVDDGGETDMDGTSSDTRHRDSGVPRLDSGTVDGAMGTCTVPIDCERQFGPAMCPTGPGGWTCENGACVVKCVGNSCNTDCDCPRNTACLGQQCTIANRNNECCLYPCPSGQSCVEPDGTRAMCPGDSDAGTMCFNDCDCPIPLGCFNGQCSANTRDRPNQCCGNGPCPPGEGCELPGGGGMACPQTPPDAGTFCMNDCDCQFPEGCLNGQCVANMRPRPNLCCSAPDCFPNQFCELPGGGSSTCPGPITQDAGPSDGLFRDASTVDSGMPSVPIGAACSPGAGTCTAMGFCIGDNQGFPGGYCSEDCSMTMCPQNASCFDVGRMNSICLEDCSVPADCRMGYGCVRLGLNPQPVCWPLPPTSMNPMGQPVGSGCMMDNECQSGLQCLQLPGGGFPGGYCTKVYCDPNTNACPSGSDCYAFPGLFSLCLNECPNAGTQSTCRPGYYCLGPTGQSGVCVGM